MDQIRTVEENRAELDTRGQVVGQGGVPLANRLDRVFDRLGHRATVTGRLPQVSAGRRALIEVLKRINTVIEDPNFELGISYFLREDLVDSLEDIWTCEIEPYLEEYFYDRRPIVEEFRWRRLVVEKLAGWGGE